MIVVTGGAGFIGSVIVHAINKTWPGLDVAVIDDMESNDKWKNLNGAIVRHLVHPANTVAFLNQYSKGMSAIIHMGAISATSETNVEKLADLNIRGTLDLFRWAARHDVPFIYASSAATYGNGNQDFDDREDMPYLQALRPLNAYGFSKALVDRAIVSESYKPSQWVGLKFFNVYGPNEYHKGVMASVVYHTFNQIQQTGAMKLFKSHHPHYADGEQQRDFVYVKDIARAVLWFVENKSVSGIFNMGTGTARSFNDLATATFKAMGKQADISYIETPEHIRKHYQYFTEANMDKFQKATGGFTFTSLEDGVADYVQNHLMKEDQTL